MTEGSRSEFPLRRLFPKWGHASRSAADRLIAAARVAVNGVIVRDPEHLIDPQRDRVELDGVALAPLPKLYLMMNKPRGVVTTLRDPEGRRSVIDLLPSEWKHAKPVGRLDRDSSGLLLLTTDGDLHFAITGPDSTIEKHYHVEIAGSASDSDFDPLRRGIELDGEVLAPARVSIRGSVGRNTLLEIVLVEGRFRQIRRSLHRVGHRVRALHRVAIGSLAIGALENGHVEEIPLPEVDALRVEAGLAQSGDREIAGESEIS